MGDDHDQHAATEATPLLAASPVAPITTTSVYNNTNGDNDNGISDDDTEAEDDDDDDDDGDEDDEEEEKPLPRGQIMLLCYARLVEPIAFFSIFPYINQMLQRNAALADADVGFYSGLIESLFSLTQMCVMMAWGRAADRFGRKPVLVFSLVGVSIATSLFGLATSLWQMILFRCLAGVFAGTIVTIRVMITEHSTPSTQARSFSWFAFSGNLGILFGPLLGGALADPAEQYPSVFSGVAFFEKFPYALSSFVVGLVGFTAVITSALFLEETLPAEIRAATASHEAVLVETAMPVTAVTTAATSSTENPVNTFTQNLTGMIRIDPVYMDLLRQPGVSRALYAYAHVMILAFAYTAIVPVFWFTKVRLGGFGFTPLQISLLMGLNGFSQAAWLLLIFPRLHRKVGTNGVIRGCSVAWPFFFALMPFLNTLLRVETEFTTRLFWIIAIVAMLVGPGVAMAFTGVQLLLNDVAPDPAALSTLNAMALAQTSGLRSFSPALFTSIFAWSANNQWLLRGHSVWVVLVLMGFSLTAFVYGVGLPEGDGKGMRRGGRGGKGKKKKKNVAAKNSLRRKVRRNGNGNGNGASTSGACDD